ncbi:extracellular solute-binding protein [Thiovibrio frasassiensis]|uniref:Extracellular solute-binding protein n=1 Tax=Thiovibrio frasassiensis TaxID=2984131 RepID=A0A9X4MI30_9BACT|nr:extracellular solute-binding protein [Thiovibrio frasassiensis]MDG4476741.1 extracellular solute-binding protein [Thiovibrio frasassiensis]
MKIFFSALLALLFALPSSVFGAQGISIDGIVKYPPGFHKFDYASDKARKGGQLVLHDLGSYDKLNPFTLKGTSPAGLEDLVFETLAVPSLDEPFASYGLIAKDIVVAEDRLSVTFTIHEAARFSDGTPITPEDVKFSLDTLKSPAASPSYQIYFQDITSAEVLDPHRVRFHFSQRNRELHMIASQLPVFSKKFYTSHPFDAPDMTPPVASGPYLIKEVIPGKSITYARNPHYWGKDLNVRRGMFNFDTIVYKYFKDQIVAVEAFKAGEFDFMPVNIAKQWARDLDGPKFKRGELVRETLSHKNNAGMQGFVFNLRKPVFQDRMVRKALSLAFDFEWTNAALFFNQYTRCDSFFSNSAMSAKGLPAGLELSYLAPFRATLPPEVFTTPPTPFSTTPPASLRANLIQAKDILNQAGWRVQNGVLTNSAGQVLEFEILLVGAGFERVMEPYINNLKKLGVVVHSRVIDPALYIRRMDNFDFDMTVSVFGQAQSPGNEQRNYWHSLAAERKGSRNLIGIADPAVDQLVDRIIYAETQAELTAASKALDRVLWYGYYVVPNWYLAKHRIAYRNIFARPQTLPLYYSPSQALMTWWLVPTNQRH